MRNLFSFLLKNNFTLVFILFEGISIYLIVKNDHYQNATVLNSSNNIAASVLSVGNDVKEYVNLKKNNENLARENAQLRTILPASFYENKIKLPVTENVAKNIVSLPIHPKLSESDVKLIIKSVNRFAD